MFVEGIYNTKRGPLANDQHHIASAPGPWGAQGGHGEPKGPRGPNHGEPMGAMGKPSGPNHGEPKGPRGPNHGEPRGGHGAPTGPRGPNHGEPMGAMGSPWGPRGTHGQKDKTLKKKKTNISKNFF